MAQRLLLLLVYGFVGVIVFVSLIPIMSFVVLPLELLLRLSPFYDSKPASILINSTVYLLSVVASLALLRGLLRTAFEKTR